MDECEKVVTYQTYQIKVEDRHVAVCAQLGLLSPVQLSAGSISSLHNMRQRAVFSKSNSTFCLVYGLNDNYNKECIQIPCFVTILAW